MPTRSMLVIPERFMTLKMRTPLAAATVTALRTRARG